MIVVNHTDMSVRGWVASVDMNDDSRFGHVDMVNAIVRLARAEAVCLWPGAG
ncbi:hypothetical protein ACNKHK_16400 [Shigella flexneri]